MDVLVNTNLPPLYGLLNSELPEGVIIVSAPPIERRGGPEWNIDVSIDIKLVIDLAKIVPYVFAAWLIRRVRRFKGNHKININGKQIPVDKSLPLNLEYSRNS